MKTMDKDVEIPVVLSAEQIQALLDIFPQVQVQGTASMRMVVGIEQTLIQSVQAVQQAANAE